MPHHSRPRNAARPSWSTSHLIQRRAELLTNSRAPSTNITYNSALTSYTEFCTKHNFPLDPTPDTLSFYIAYMSSFIKPTSVASYLSGILHLLQPYFPHAREARSHPLVKNTLQGALCIANSPVQRKRPITLDDLHLIASYGAPQPSYNDLLLRALSFTSFFGLLRPSEVCLSDSPRKRDMRKIMLRHQLVIEDDMMSIPLHAHKADQQNSGNMVLLLRRDDSLNPLPIITNYLHLRDASFPINPELWTRSDGSLPNYSWFIQKIKSILGGNIGGSSFRSGGADYLARIGTDPALIQACGRWASEAYKVYLRTHPAMVHHLISTSAATYLDAHPLPSISTPTP